MIDLTSFVFVLLTLALAVGAILLMRKISSLPVWGCALPVVGWLALQAFLAKVGFFQDFKSLPPHLGLVLIPNVVLLLIAGFKRNASFPSRLTLIAPAFLVGYQSFRLLMEALLYSL